MKIVLPILISDMKSLFFDIVDDQSGLIIGRARLENLSHVSTEKVSKR